MLSFRISKPILPGNYSRRGIKIPRDDSVDGPCLFADDALASVQGVFSTCNSKTQLAYDISEICELTRCSRASVYEAIGAGSLRAVKRGRRTLILAKDLDDWLQSFPAVRAKRATAA
jgi:excisionase family DNA binding protein